MDDTHFLPSDLSECQRLLAAAFQQAMQLEAQVAQAEQRASQAEQQAAALTQQAAELDRVLEQTAASYQQLQQEHTALREELAWYQRWVFGRRRERLADSAGQGHLFELEGPTAEDLTGSDASPPAAEMEIPAHRRRRQKREIDWDQLPQVRHEYDLDDEEKQCSCCGQPMECIGQDITRQLEFQRPKLEAHVHVRPKYACRHCQDGVAAAPLPPRPIRGGIAGPGLISEVIVGKFSDHLTLYRLEDILTRSGVYLARSTLCDWVRSVAGLLWPLYELQRKLVLQSSVM
jgi:transposase